MKNKIGVVCMVLGVALLASAAVLLFRNQAEDRQAGDMADNVVEQLETLPVTSQQPDLYDPEMTEVEIDGHKYIGYVEIPVLDLKLPVMSDWDYSKLQISPCRFTGSSKTDDLVVMAHNFKKHFGNLKNLVPGDTVVFTDMDDVVIAYSVVELEILPPTAVEEMTAGEYDLTLFTCTYGGKSRVTVRCNRVA